MKINIKQFDNTLSLPKYEKGAAGCDLVCRTGITIQPSEIKAVPVNIALQIPQGYAGLIFPRSSTASRKGLMIANSVGLIDPFYNGDDNEIMVLFYNFIDQPVTIKKGDRLAQIVFIAYEQAQRNQVEKLSKSTRPLRKKKDNFVK